MGLPGEADPAEEEKKGEKMPQAWARLVAFASPSKAAPSWEEVQHRAHFFLRHVPPEQLFPVLGPVRDTKEWIGRALSRVLLNPSNFCSFNGPCRLPQCTDLASTRVHGPLDKLVYAYLQGLPLGEGRPEVQLFRVHLFLACMVACMAATGVCTLQDWTWRGRPTYMLGLTYATNDHMVPSYMTRPALALAHAVRGDPTFLPHILFSPGQYLDPDFLTLLPEDAARQLPAPLPQVGDSDACPREMVSASKPKRRLPAYFYDKVQTAPAEDLLHEAMSRGDVVLLDMILSQMPSSNRFDESRVLYRLARRYAHSGCFPIFSDYFWKKFPEDMLLQYVVAGLPCPKMDGWVVDHDHASHEAAIDWLQPLLYITCYGFGSDMLQQLANLARLTQGQGVMMRLFANIYRHQHAFGYVFYLLLLDGYLQLKVDPSSLGTLLHVPQIQQRALRFFNIVRKLPNDMAWLLLMNLAKSQRQRLEQFWKNLASKAYQHLPAPVPLTPSVVNTYTYLVLGSWHWFWSLPVRCPT